MKMRLFYYSKLLVKFFFFSGRLMRAGFSPIKSMLSMTIDNRVSDASPIIIIMNKYLFKKQIINL